ncbi:MAG TPA: S8 family serine peptidase [Vicinamibacterales bacterium]|nr:S8 family serine peptidase [Vicinamibacterales bacterium]
MRASRTVRVAVVDSGIHVHHPHIADRVTGGVAVDARGQECSGNDGYVDRLGHGTAIAAAILEKAPDAELHAVKVFDRTLSTTITGLVAGIDWAIRSGMHVVNLSLGTAKAEHEPLLTEVVSRARDRGVIIVAARDDGGVRWLPGSLEGVLPVQLDEACPRDCYRVADVDGVAVFRASGFPRPIDGLPPERNLSGISFAVANMTGFVARALASPAASASDEIEKWLTAHG